MDYSANLVIDAGKYWNVPFDPRCVCDDRNFNRQKEVFMEVTVLGVIPSESLVLEVHEVLK